MKIQYVSAIVLSLVLLMTGVSVTAKQKVTVQNDSGHRLAVAWQALGCGGLHCFGDKQSCGGTEENSRYIGKTCAYIKKATTVPKSHSFALSTSRRTVSIYDCTTKKFFKSKEYMTGKRSNQIS